MSSSAFRKCVLGRGTPYRVGARPGSSPAGESLGPEQVLDRDTEARCIAFGREWNIYEVHQEWLFVHVSDDV